MAVTLIPAVKLVTLRAVFCFLENGKRCGSRAYMDYMIAACALGALLICLAAVGIFRDYDIEISFHPPVFFKVKITRARRP